MRQTINPVSMQKVVWNLFSGFQTTFFYAVLENHKSACATHYQACATSYSGLNLNQDKARQRRTGLKLIHYKIRMTVTKRSSEKSTSTEIPIYNPLDTRFQTTTQGGSIIPSQSTAQTLRTRYPRIFSFMRLKNLSALRQIPINPKY